jgi:ABC-type branched-subunit amino acid transport system ATPase component
MIEVKGLNAFYGAIQALKNVSLSVKKGDIVAIIGANGAGKTTLLNTISGLIRKYNGGIFYEAGLCRSNLQCLRGLDKGLPDHAGQDTQGS